jgi:hypothetical protein
MRFYLEYINHLGRLQKKKSAHRRLQAGFTITEVLLAGVMMLIAVLVSGIGVINLLRSNYRANADSEIRNNLNRTLEFVSDDLRRARDIPFTEAAIQKDQLPTGARAVLAFRIPDPSNLGQILSNQIVYYTKGPENSLTGPRVLWRYGPDLDANGNYINPKERKHYPVTDMLAATAATANNPLCPEDFNLIAADPGDVDGFYACVRQKGGQVILNANAQVEMTTLTGGTRDKVDYAASTRVATRSTSDEIFSLTVTDSPYAEGLVLFVPELEVAANVKAQLIEPNFCQSCTVAAGPLNEKNPPPGVAIPSTVAGTTVKGNAGDGLVVHITPTLSNREYVKGLKVQGYDFNSPNPPRSLEKNQILLVFTTTSPPNSYQVLLTATPR